MKEYPFPVDEHSIEDGVDRLIDDLKNINSSGSDISERETDSLSLIVDEALNGVDIRNQYPDFYASLLKSFELRSLFIETLLQLKQPPDPEVERSFAVSRADLAFLRTPAQSSPITDWKITLQRTRDQLMSVFFPPQTVLRSGGSALSEPFYTLLRSDFKIDQTLYTLMVEGTLHENRDDALAIFLNVAVSQGTFHPLQATLKWGTYASLTGLNAEGRTRIADLPLCTVFDDSLRQVEADLALTLTAKI